MTSPFEPNITQHLVSTTMRKVLDAVEKEMQVKLTSMGYTFETFKEYTESLKVGDMAHDFKEMKDYMVERTDYYIALYTDTLKN